MAQYNKALSVSTSHNVGFDSRAGQKYDKALSVAMSHSFALHRCYFKVFSTVVISHSLNFVDHICQEYNKVLSVVVSHVLTFPDHPGRLYYKTLSVSTSHSLNFTDRLGLIYDKTLSVVMSNSLNFNERLGRVYYKLFFLLIVHWIGFAERLGRVYDKALSAVTSHWIGFAERLGRVYDKALSAVTSHWIGFVKKKKPGSCTGVISADVKKQRPKRYAYHGKEMSCHKPPKPAPFIFYPTVCGPVVPTNLVLRPYSYPQVPPGYPSNFFNMSCLPVPDLGEHWKNVCELECDNDATYIHAPDQDHDGREYYLYKGPVMDGVIESIQLKAFIKTVPFTTEHQYTVTFMYEHLIAEIPGYEEYWGGYIDYPLGDYTLIPGEVRTTNVFTGLPWTWEDLSKMGMGVYINAAYSGLDVRVSQIFMIVRVI